MQKKMILDAAQLKWPVLLYLALSVFAASTFSQPMTRPFLEPEGRKPPRAEPYEFDQWNFGIWEYQFEVNRRGIGRRLSAKMRTTRFRVEIQSDEEIERIYFSEYKSDLLLLCEVNAGGYGSGFIVRLDGETLRQRWRVNIPAFNVAQGLIEDNSAYLGAIGFAAKLDLNSGRYLWKHHDFYRKYHKDGAFNMFELPRISGDEVIYTEGQEMYKRKPNTVRFNKKNGKILKVELNK
jgi:hypothetical protein